MKRDGRQVESTRHPPMGTRSLSSDRNNHSGGGSVINVDQYSFIKEIKCQPSSIRSTMVLESSCSIAS